MYPPAVVTFPVTGTCSTKCYHSFQLNAPPSKFVAFNVVNVPVVPVIVPTVTGPLNVDVPAQVWFPVHAKS